MSDAQCWGRECKLGWGYNKDLNLFVSVQGEPPNVTSQVTNGWNYNWPKNLSSIDISYQVSLLFAL